MNKEQRQKAGYKRMTAYFIAEGFNMKLLIGFLKREHNVMPRVFDEAVYTVSSTTLLSFLKGSVQCFLVDVLLAAITRVWSKCERSFLRPSKNFRCKIASIQTGRG